ncbi:hypothetical protein [Oscillibacter sp. GMB15532]|uniref:hypothetical protein n=1 Tax=Oscillibacter sp. GMB15532 TaxID=3230022 RepID=UPI0034DFB1DE
MDADGVSSSWRPVDAGENQPENEKKGPPANDTPAAQMGGILESFHDYRTPYAPKTQGGKLVDFSLILEKPAFFKQGKKENPQL